MKNRAAIIVSVILTLGLVLAVAGDHSRTVEVDDYYVDDGTIEVTFIINNEDKSGTFTWEVSYDFAGMARKDSRSQSWSAGDTTADASMYLGSDVKVHTVRVKKVTLQ